MTKEIRRLVAEMCVGMFLYVLVLGGLAVVFRRGLAGMGFMLWPVLAGLVAGFFADVVMLVHMAFVAERATDSRDSGYANRFTVVQSVLRKVIFVAALFFLGSRPQIDAVSMIIGTLGLQAGAFLQPAVHRLISRDGSSAESGMYGGSRHSLSAEGGMSGDDQGGMDPDAGVTGDSQYVPIHPENEVSGESRDGSTAEGSISRNPQDRSLMEESPAEGKEPVSIPEESSAPQNFRKKGG